MTKRVGSNTARYQMMPLRSAVQGETVLTSYLRARSMPYDGSAQGDRALHLLHGHRERGIRVWHVQQMVYIETIGGTERDLGRGEGEGQVAGGG
jgi:hypothetical protein